MSRDLPLEIVKAMTERNTDAQLLWLVRITGATGGDTDLRYVNDTESVVGPDGQTYLPYPFSVTLPVQSGEEAPRIEVSVRDVALRVVTYLLRNTNELTANIYAVQRGVTQAKTGSKRTWHEPIVSYEGFSVREAVSNAEVVGFNLTMDHFFGEPLGKHSMDAHVAPWLY